MVLAISVKCIFLCNFVSKTNLYVIGLYEVKFLFRRQIKK